MNNWIKIQIDKEIERNIIEVNVMIDLNLVWNFDRFDPKSENINLQEQLC